MGIPAERVEFVAPRLRFDMSIATNWKLDIRFQTKVIGYYEKFIIYDMRNIYSPMKIKNQGFKYYSIGR